jgi:plasmid stability protein
MIELPPDVEHQLREQAARHGKDVADFLRLILNQNPILNIDHRTHLICGIASWFEAAA